MLSMPAELFEAYGHYLSKRKVVASSHEEYRQYLSDFLSFRQSLINDKAQCIRLFLHSLEDNALPQLYRQHAANAVSLYFQMIREQDQPLNSKACSPEVLEDSIGALHLLHPTSAPNHNEIPDSLPTQLKSVYDAAEKPCRSNVAAGLSVPSDIPTTIAPFNPPTFHRNSSDYSEAGYALTSESAEWDDLIGGGNSFSRLTTVTFRLLLVKTNPIRRASHECVG